MPRAPRHHVPGDFYHVISRGNHRETVFRDERDFRRYLELMERYSQRYGVKVHAYALMRNHTHLLVEEGEQQSFAQYSNTRYRQSGHLFQGRYMALRVQQEEYLLGLVRYIHMNPVKAGIVTDPADYPWSSHRHYYHGEVGYGVDTSLIMSLMAQSGGTEIADYELLSEKPERETDEVRPLTLSSDPPTPIEEIAESVVRVTAVPRDRLLSRQRDRSTSAARWLFIYLAIQNGYSMTVVARYLGISVNAVSKAVQVIEADLRVNGPWSERYQQMIYSGSRYI